MQFLNIEALDILAFILQILGNLLACDDLKKAKEVASTLSLFSNLEHILKSRKDSHIVYPVLHLCSNLVTIS